MATIERHPPERRANRGVVVACTGSCCCCCCCLHTVGGIVGAAIAAPGSARSVLGSLGAPCVEVQASQDSAAKAAGVYWRLLGICVLPTLIAPVIVIFCLPLVQLVASAVAAILIGLNWPYQFPDRNAAIQQILSMTWKSIAGTILGVFIMVLLGLAFSAIAG